MLEIETKERFIVGLKTASDRARELSKAKKSKNWLKIAEMLDGIRIKGVAIYDQTSLTRQEILKTLDARVGKKVEKESVH